MTPREARIESDGGVVCERCVVADSFRLRLRGLMGRRSIGSEEGLLLVGRPSIHTSFNRCRIDAVSLERELGVIGVKENLKAWRVAGRWKAKHILELRSGEAARRGVGAGARLRLIEPATAPVAAPARPKDDGGIRVVLGASDRRFLRVASFLLGRNGFAVSTATRFADLMGAVERGEPDIVVLDASPPARWTTRAAVALQGWGSDVGVLLVTDEPIGGVPQMLPKWGSFDRLTEEIRRTHSRTLSGVLPA